MIEHPVPQNVTGYQFRLVGDMTLKQFLELVAGGGVAWLIWTINLPAFIKYPLVLLSVFGGFAAAFLPLEDRPLDQWFISFFKAIYRPTLFTWKKPKRDDIFQFTPKPEEQTKTLAAAAKAPSAGLKTLIQLYQLQETEQEAADPLEKTWTDRQQTIPKLFAEVVVSKKLANETTFPQKLTFKTEKPETSVVIRPLSVPQNPAAILHGEITLPPRQPKIPPLVEIKVGTDQLSSKSNLVDTGPSVATAPDLPAAATKAPTLNVAQAAISQYSLPALSTSPNILSGMVLTQDGRIVESAIVEIRDQHGLPVRALKTNKLGQFSIATPLPNGNYELEIEKDGLSFDILKIEAKGEIMQPIEIRAKLEKT